MTDGRTLVSDGLWVGSLQIVAALGHLAGIRLLTELLPPRIFGEFGLWLGVIPLVIGTLGAPTMQALLRFYPEYSLSGSGMLVRRIASRQIIRLALWSLPLLAGAAAVVFVREWGSLVSILLLAALIVVELVRMQGGALLNSTRAHRAYGMWSVAEAWGRPVMAWWLISWVGAGVSELLAGYLLASLSVLMVMWRFVPRDADIKTEMESTAVARQFWAYVLPLLPLGFLGWVSGTVDRYLIGILLSPAEVGLYVAIYGLASRPMLLLSGVLETTLRPVYQEAVVRKDYNFATTCIRRWVGMILACSAFALMFTWIAYDWLAALLLGEAYRSAASLMFWIVAGYVPCLLYHVASRIMYAHGATSRILMAETAGAIAALVLGFVFINQAGLVGAALAVPVYFGVQLVIGVTLARKRTVWNSV